MFVMVAVTVHELLKNGCHGSCQSARAATKYKRIRHITLEETEGVN